MDKSIGSICMDWLGLSACDGILANSVEFKFVGAIMHIPYVDNSADVMDDDVGTNRFASKQKFDGALRNRYGFVGLQYNRECGK